MKKKIKRAIFVLNTEGLFVFYQRFLEVVKTFLRIRKADTYIFCIFLNNHKIKMQISDFIEINELEFCTFTDLEQLKNNYIECKKLLFLPIIEFFDRNSICFAAIFNKKIIAYTWVHTSHYHNCGPKSISLYQNEVYIGPFYTNPKYRRNGLYHFMMYHSLKYLKTNNYKTVYTSCNSKNIASIKVFIRHGFKIVGIIREKKKKTLLIELTDEKSLSNRLHKVD